MTVNMHLLSYYDYEVYVSRCCQLVLSVFCCPDTCIHLLNSSICVSNASLDCKVTLDPFEHWIHFCFSICLCWDCKTCTVFTLLKLSSVFFRRGMLYFWGEFGHVPELCIFSGIGFVTCCGQFGSGQTPIKLIFFEENVFIECHRSVALMRLYVSVFNQNKLSEN